MREFVENYCNQYQDRCILIEQGRQYTYNELYVRIHKLIAFIDECQFQQHDLIGVIGYDNIDYITASLAIMAYGCTMVALPANLSQEMLLGCAYKYALKGIFYGDGQQEKINFIQNNNYHQIVAHIPSIVDNYTATFDYIIHEDNNTSQAIATIMFTTGTEGNPKGVMLTHKNLLTGARNGLLGFGPFGYVEDNQTYQLTIPLTHTFGFVRNLLCCIQTGSKLIISQDNVSIFADMQKYQPTRLITVPGLCEIIAKMIKQYGKEFIGTQLEYIVIGGADFSSKLINDMSAFGITVYGGYGMTETANLFTGNPEPNKYPDSIGYLYPNEEIKVINDELWVKGDNVFVGYYGEDNTKLFDKDGFFPTGDLVRIDDDTGFMYFIGRKKDIIVLSSGTNIAPIAIEEYFVNNLNFIEECMVYSLNNNQLICEIYAPHRPDDISILYDLNEAMPIEQRVHQFIFRNQPFTKDKKMSIVRKRSI